MVKRKIMEVASNGVDYLGMSEPDFLRAVDVDPAKWAAAFNQLSVALGYSKMNEGWIESMFASAMMNALDRERGRSPVLLFELSPMTEH